MDGRTTNEIAVVKRPKREQVACKEPNSAILYDNLFLAKLL